MRFDRRGQATLPDLFYSAIRQVTAQAGELKERQKSTGQVESSN